MRWNEWYDSKMPLIAACAYDLSLQHPAPWKVSIFKVFIALLFYAFFIAFGYLVNDYSDREVDSRAGKVRVVQSLSDCKAITILVSLFIGGWLALLPYWGDGVQLFGVVSFAYVANVSYSLPPLRLKERGLIGLVCAAVAQRVLPVLIIGIIWQDFHVEIIGWAAIGLLVGIRYILIHQFEDMASDKISGVKNFVSKRPTIIPVLMWVVFISELFFLLGLVYAISQREPLFTWIACLITIYLISYLSLYRTYIGKFDLFSYVYVPLEDVYSIFLPVSLLVLLIKADPLWALLLPIEFLWKYRCIRQYMALPARWITSKFSYSR